VNVESDIVNSIHGVLLIEISESAASNSRSQQCNLEENPFSLGNNPFFQHLYIQTDGVCPAFPVLLFPAYSDSAVMHRDIFPLSKWLGSVSPMLHRLELLVIRPSDRE